MKTYNQIEKEHQDAYDSIMRENSVFWAFSDKQFEEGLKELKEKGQILPGEKLTRIFGGGFLPSKNVDKWHKALKEADKTQKKELKEAKQAKE